MPGCYTCRLRKVRCQSATMSQVKCSNCHRLGFECRWQPPQPGETFVAPPKRRRNGTTSGRESRQTDCAAGSSTTVPASDHELFPQSLPTLTKRQECGGSVAIEDEIVDRQTQAHTQPRPQTVVEEASWIDFDFDTFLAELSAPPQPDLSYDLRRDATVDASQLGAAMWSTIGDSSPSLSTDRSTLALDDDSMVLVEHYLDALKKYAKVEDLAEATGNVYISAFLKAIFLPILLQAILAYSSLHLSLIDPSRHSLAQKHNEAATRAINSIPMLSAADVDIEGMLAAVYIMLKRHHTAATNETIQLYQDLFKVATHLVVMPRAQVLLSDPTSLARGLVRRIGYHDCRMTMFRLGGGDFVETMRGLPALAEVFVTEDREARENGWDLLSSNLLRLEVSQLDQHLEMYRSNLIAQPPSPAAVDTLFLKIRKAIAATTSDSQLPPSKVIDPAVYQKWISVSALHSALLYLWLLYPLPQYSTSQSIDWILHHHLLLLRDETRSGTPSSIWPTSLFLVGLVDKDEIHRDWIVRQFESMQAWGRHHLRAANLLRHVWNGETKTHIDVRNAMLEAGGLFML